MVAHPVRAACLEVGGTIPPLWRETLAQVRQDRSGQAPDDDLTFLLLHHNAGGPPRLTLGQTLGVYAKVFGLKRV